MYVERFLPHPPKFRQNHIKSILNFIIARFRGIDGDAKKGTV